MANLSPKRKSFNEIPITLTIKHLIYSVIFILICLNVSAQRPYSFGILPTVNINKKLENGWKLNFKTESRQRFVQGTLEDGKTEEYEYVLTDFALVASRKINFNSTVTGGYQIRFRNGEVIQRTIQQYVLRPSYDKLRIAYRLAADQTFTPEEDTEYRLRFRVSSEFPLSGQSVDTKEWYFKFNNEYLTAWEGSTFDLEVRLVSVIGFQLTDQIKLETGIDYRLDSFVEEQSRQRTWGAMTGYFSF